MWNSGIAEICGNGGICGLYGGNQTKIANSELRFIHAIMQKYICGLYNANGTMKLKQYWKQRKYGSCGI